MWKSAGDFIDAKGRATAVAAKIGYSPGTVRVWKFRGAIPRDAWPDILKAFEDVTLDDLLKIERCAEPERAAS